MAQTSRPRRKEIRCSSTCPLCGIGVGNSKEVIKAIYENQKISGSYESISFHIWEIYELLVPPADLLGKIEYAKLLGMDYPYDLVDVKEPKKEKVIAKKVLKYREDFNLFLAIKDTLEHYAKNPVKLSKKAFNTFDRWTKKFRKSDQRTIRTILAINIFKLIYQDRIVKKITQSKAEVSANYIAA